MIIKERAKQLKTDIPAIFLCLKDTNTAIITKTLALITIIYALFPIDLIPDFIPVLGYLDDIIILPFLIALTLKTIPKETFQQYRKEANELYKAGISKKWYYSIPIILIWFLMIYLILKLLNFTC